MKYTLIDILSPHYCCSCGEIGDILCNSCKYDIISEPISVCLVCKQPKLIDAVCMVCSLPYEKSFCVGERSGGLEKLINASKYESIREGCLKQAELLSEMLPNLPSGVILTTIPTISRHVRQRGYDHSQLLAKRLSKLRGLPFCETLERVGSFVQQGASSKDRDAQASKSYRVREGAVEHKVYLLVDDVVTTGSTLKHASLALLSAGAKEVWVATTAYQPK